MKKLFKLQSVVPLLAGLLIAVFVSQPARAEFSKRFYVGLGGGISFIEPRPNTASTGYVNDESSDGAGKIFIGWDFAERWAVEGYVADLGAATLKADSAASPQPAPSSGDVDYQAAGLSALYHIYNTEGSYGFQDRTGISVFAKAGVGSLNTDSEGLAINQLEDTQIMLGIGVEIGFDSGLAVRAEYEGYDEDAQLASVGVLWRFGGGDSGRSTPRSTQASLPEPDIRVEALPNKPEIIPVPLTDSDFDGVANEADACPSSAAGSSVDSTGCSPFNGLFNGSLEGVNFVSGSADLTTEASEILDGVAAELLRNPDVRVAVMAHTDNAGAASANLDLSKSRAVSVAKYLVSRGVAASRLRPEAYGESNPVVSNATAEGRKQNRRVELRTLN